MDRVFVHLFRVRDKYRDHVLTIFELKQIHFSLSLLFFLSYFIQRDLLGPVSPVELLSSSPLLMHGWSSAQFSRFSFPLH